MAFVYDVFLSLLVFILAVKRIQCNGCGHRPVDASLEGRIVGGKDAFYGQVPWQALIKEAHFFGLLNYRKCGGVLISNKWVLTAAHCNAGWFGKLNVVLGEHDIKKWYKNETVAQRSAKRVVVHPMFNRLLLLNDIALIELEDPVEYDENIQPICLPAGDDQFADETGYVSGWGYTAYRNGALPNILQVVNLPILSNAECHRMYLAGGFFKAVGPEVVCAGYAEGGKDSCEGDSGGPLMVYSKKAQSWVLVGVVSNGIRCAEPNLPGIYTRVSAFRDWIKSVMSTPESYSFWNFN